MRAGLIVRVTLSTTKSWPQPADRPSSTAPSLSSAIGSSNSEARSSVGSCGTNLPRAASSRIVRRSC